MLLDRLIDVAAKDGPVLVPLAALGECWPEVAVQVCLVATAAGVVGQQLSGSAILLDSVPQALGPSDLDECADLDEVDLALSVRLPPCFDLLALRLVAFRLQSANRDERLD